MTFTEVRFRPNGGAPRTVKWPSWPYPAGNAEEPRVKTPKCPAMKALFRSLALTEKLKGK